MGKNIDLTKPLSDEDKTFLHERSRDWEIAENERFLNDNKKGKPEEPVFVPANTVAPASFEPSVKAEEVEEVDVEELSVDELKAELHSLGQPTTGSKAELQKRLNKALED